MAQRHLKNSFKFFRKDVIMYHAEECILYFKTLVKKDVLCYSLTAKPGDSKYFQATHYIRRQKIKKEYKQIIKP